MSHTLSRFVFVFLISGCFVSLSSAFAVGSPQREDAKLYTRCPVAMPQVRKAEWTIMIYMNGDNNLSYAAIEDFKEMAQVSYGPKVNVVIQMDLIGGNNTNERWGETRRFFMRKGLRPTRSCSLPGFKEEANMGSLTTLAEFVFWARRSFPAERYALIIWDHGDGWRLIDKEFPTKTPEGLARQRRSAVSKAEDRLASGYLSQEDLASLKLAQDPIGSQFRAISEDSTNEGDRLFIREIQDALEWVLKGRARLDLIGFDACLMQMIENAYALRRVANVMVGSEELEPDTGWSYEHWLKQLVNNPTMNAAALGKLLVQSYKETYEKTVPTTTLSAVNISRYNIEKLATAVTAFAEHLIGNIDSQHIKDARNHTLKYAPCRNYHGIDLHRFAFLIAGASGADPGLRAQAREVQRLVEQIVIDRYVGNEREGEYGSYGLAIYFPESGKAFKDDPFGPGYTEENIFYVVQWVLEQKWDQFLSEYFTEVPGPLPPSNCKNPYQARISQ